MPGATDNDVIEMAKKEGYIILTFDKDYGEIIFRHSLAEPPPVIFFRYKGTHPNFAGEFMVSMLRQKTILLKDHFTVVEQNNIRQRPYANF